MPALSPVLRADSPASVWIPGQCGAELAAGLPLVQVPARGLAQFRVAPAQVQGAIGPGRQLQAVQAERDALPMRLQDGLLDAPYAEEPVLAPASSRRSSQPPPAGGRSAARFPAGAVAAAAAPGPRPAARLRPAPPAAPRRCAPAGAVVGQRAAQFRPALVITDQRQRLRVGAQCLRQHLPRLRFTTLARHMRAPPDRHRTEAPRAIEGGWQLIRTRPSRNSTTGSQPCASTGHSSPPEVRSWASSSG